ncbi:nucleoside 2-deoxyribosyltransferase domain-containing protein [Actinocrispum wychmicini]|uniref:Nucleoside 2-deoxyribosyltransferase-like protein n=1 Tax=Actinocrispum wychmicini TaxID=1213861 RepID=A0A4R2K3U1_9PSEU|nr:nucleoside 2-deoxyribosyltransferase domain-containing protein [Actinocrispum wychmicini]TCO64448.1 nucleoside 2-deoxyribosyltransferase-like protein [Actinocrispum wychmicini]
MIEVVYAGQEPPDEWDASIFLAGPTPRSATVPSWRPGALAELCRQSNVGVLVVFVPEAAGGTAYPDYDDQVAWEERWLDAADTILFWVPRDMATLPGLTTNVEFGRYESSGRVVLGAPEDAQHVRYLQHHARKHGAPVLPTLSDTVAAALASIEAGARRSGGERFVPLVAWRSPTFRTWVAAQQNAGNILLDGRLAWIQGQFIWAYHARMYVTAEDRVKANEFVLGRPDVVSIVAYRPGETPWRNEVVLVKEFRLPAGTSDGYVHELPGGGVLDGSPIDQAVHEMAEETGLRVAPERLRLSQVRQVVATLCAHRLHVFTVELTAEEIAYAHENPGPYGVHEDSERTFVEVRTYREILADELVDWSTLGVLNVVFSAPGP